DWNGRDCQPACSAFQNCHSGGDVATVTDGEVNVDPVGGQYFGGTPEEFDFGSAVWKPLDGNILPTDRSASGEGLKCLVDSLLGRQTGRQGGSRISQSREIGPLGCCQGSLQNS